VQPASAVMARRAAARRGASRDTAEEDSRFG
jgi:hypothetical protein